MIGTRAPSTPGGIRVGQESQALGEHVAGFEVRDHEHVGLPGDGRSDVLDLRRAEVDGVVEGKRPVEDPARDLAAIGHLTERRGFDSRGHLRVHGLHSGQDRDPHGLDAQRVREVDCVLDDVDLLLEGRSDVDSRIGHDQCRGMVRHVHHEAVTDPARRPQPVPPDHGGHELVRVQTPLHQRFGLAGLDERDGLLGGGVAVRRVDDAEGREIRLEAGRGRGDLLTRSDQDRIDDPERGGLAGGAERGCIAGVRDRDLQRW